MVFLIASLTAPSSAALFSAPSTCSMCPSSSKSAFQHRPSRMHTAAVAAGLPIVELCVEVSLDPLVGGGFTASMTCSCASCAAIDLLFNRSPSAPVCPAQVLVCAAGWPTHTPASAGCLCSPRVRGPRACRGALAPRPGRPAARLGGAVADALVGLVSPTGRLHMKSWGSLRSSSRVSAPRAA